MFGIKAPGQSPMMYVHVPPSRPFFPRFFCPSNSLRTPQLQLTVHFRLAAPGRPIRSPHRLPLTATWRGYGAADTAHAHDAAVSLYPPGLGADPTGGASLCAHPAERVDTAPVASGSAVDTPHAEFHDVPSATVVVLTL